MLAVSGWPGETQELAFSVTCADAAPASTASRPPAAKRIALTVERLMTSSSITGTEGSALGDGLPRRLDALDQRLLIPDLIRQQEYQPRVQFGALRLREPFVRRDERRVETVGVGDVWVGFHRRRAPLIQTEG